MPRLRAWLARLAGTLRSRPPAAELQEELEAHLEFEIADLVSRGMDPAAARRQALMHAGGLAQAAEAVDDQRRLPSLANRWADLRYALRGLRRAPGFSAIVIGTLALGIGATTAIFSVVEAVVLRPLPHRDGERLVYLRQMHDGADGASIGFSVPEVRDLRNGAPAFAAVAELSPWTITLQRPEGAERVDIALVTGNWFEVMGLKPILGRVTGPADDGPGVPPVAVLTWDGWRHRFGGDSAVVGRQVTMDGKSVTVIGVLQPAPFFPGRADAIVNMVVSEHHLSATMVEGRTHRMTEVVARLGPAATEALAQEQVNATFTRLGQEYPDVYPAEIHSHVAVIPFRVVMAERVRLLLGLLAGAALCALILAVASVANLTLMRGVTREPELAVRAALGAGRGRLRRLLLAENLVLAAAGAAFGTVLALGGIRLLTALVARYSPRADEIRLDPAALGLTLAVALGVALLLSLLASLPEEHRLGAWILAGGQRAGTGRPRLRVQRALVVVQVAVSVVLLAGAALLSETLFRLSEVATGLQTEEVLSVSVPLLNSSEIFGGPPAYNRAWANYESMRQRLAELPGVSDAGIGYEAPLDASNILLDLKVEGAADPGDGHRPRAALRTASPEYFRASGIPLVAGRGFEATDRVGTARVVVLNELLAHQLFPRGDALGRQVAWTGDVLRFTPFSPEWRTVVGIVGTTHQGDLDAAPVPMVYMPFAQEVPFSGTLVVRADSNIAALVPAVTRIVRELAPTAPMENLHTITQVRDASLAPRRLNAVLLTAFGVLALLVAAVGIAGVLAFSVRARTNEIGIRMSLGAAPSRVTAMIIREGGLLVVLGLAGGLAGAWFTALLLRGLLWGVEPHDPTALTGVAVAIAAIGLAACWLPAARAARIDPAITMRAP